VVARRIGLSIAEIDEAGVGKNRSSSVYPPCALHVDDEAEVSSLRSLKNRLSCTCLPDDGVHMHRQSLSSFDLELGILCRSQGPLYVGICESGQF